MKKLLAIVLILFSLHAVFAAAKTGPAPAITGAFVKAHGNTLGLRTGADTFTTFTLARGARWVSSTGAVFFRNWLFPGDGVEVVQNEKGEAEEIVIRVGFHPGVIAFVSPDRITLADGHQYYLEPSTPFFLNGERIQDDSGLKSPEPVLIRINPASDEVVGVWGFDFSKHSGKPQNIFRTAAAPENLAGKFFLRVSVEARSGGKLSASLPGAAGSFALKEEKNEGEYDGLLPVPANLSVGRCYLMLVWAPANARKSGANCPGEPCPARETRIARESLSIYTLAPRFSDIEPPDKTETSIDSPFIFATFDAEGNAPDPNSLQLFIDGKDVTQSCYRDAGLLFFDPGVPLAPGEHRCLVKGKSQDALLSFSRKWSFTIKGEESGIQEK